MSDKSKELQTAIKAAENASKVALKYFGHKPTVEFKEDNSPVTKADKESEEVIKKTILKSFPKAKFVGEESGGNTNEEEFWIIDPIDGTKYFIKDLPFWAILIALCRKREIILGISYMPIFGELLYAQKGKGAFLNDKLIRVSSISFLENAFFNFGTMKKFLNQKNIFKLAERCTSSKGIGNPYGYQQVACGRMEISMDIKAYVWDLAPFKCIIEEAGGKFTNFEGDNWQLTNTTAVATNGLLHDEVIRILNEA